MMNTIVLSMKYTTGNRPCSQPGPNSGPLGPPKNSVTTTADWITTPMNSLSMNMPNRMPEYSVWNPATSSPSASARSNGGRWVSATMPTMNTAKAGNRGRNSQLGAPGNSPLPAAWAATMSETRKEPT